MPAITVTLLLITAGSLICSMILWRLLTAQNNKAQTAYASHRKEHKAVLAKTKAERRELRLLLNAFDDALVITSEAGTIQVANESAIKLSKGQKLRGKSIASAFQENEICELIKDAMRNNEPTKTKIILNNSSFGQKNSIEDSAWIIDYAPLPSSDPTDPAPLHRIILRNVTAEHRTDQVKREFVANASHELRTPLAIISGYLENLIDDDVVDSPATSRRILTIMRKHSERIALLIEEMLIISKLESSDGAQLNHDPFLLNDTITTVIDRLTPVFQKQNATIKTTYTPDTIQLTGDSFYWEQALFNIIENALKQNADTPLHIRVSATICPANQELTLNITDNGKGIPAAHLPYIFNRFYRVQKHHSQNEVKGTGLGLSIVKHAIEAHGGTITVSSTPGIETTFTITCPAPDLQTLTPPLAEG
ncbi:MAG: ATP-binding protein [Akkermansiaceae bacterium]